MVSGAGEWWAGYFDQDFARLYRPLLPPEETAAEVAGVLELLGLPHGSRLLDLACGWGRHSVPLAEAGYAVTGLDLSGALLGQARAAALTAGVAVDWVHADMRDLAYQGEFDAAVSLFSSLGYFRDAADDERVLRGLCRALRPGGRFLLETMHRDHVAREFVERDWWEDAAGTRVWVEREFDAVTGVSRESLRWRGPDGVEGEKHHEIRLRTATEWAEMLRRVGLVPVEWLGDWDLRPFSHAAERMIVVAETGG